MNALFPDIVGTWRNSRSKRNFRVSRDTFVYLCAELQPVLSRKFVVRKPTVSMGTRSKKVFFFFYIFLFNAEEVKSKCTTGVLRLQVRITYGY